MTSADNLLPANILVLDDDPVVRFLLTETLNLSGYVVTAHDNWTAAQNALNAQLGAQSFKLLMVDLIMPDITGFEVIKNVRATHPELPIILLSANADQAVNAQAKESKPDALLEKPWNSVALLQLIAELIRVKNS